MPADGIAEIVPVAETPGSFRMVTVRGNKREWPSLRVKPRGVQDRIRNSPLAEDLKIPALLLVRNPHREVVQRFL